MKYLWLLALLLGEVYAAPLRFESGVIKAHTEVMGDRTIDPMTRKATSHLSLNGGIDTLSGSIEISLKDLVSDNAKRDGHMQETFESHQFPKAIFTLKDVISKGGNTYTLQGTMNLHGINRPMSFDGTIVASGDTLRIKATTSMKMSSFGIKPPRLVFLTVRDQVDLSVDVTLAQ